jgi:hypothetical protein
VDRSAGVDDDPAALAYLHETVHMRSSISLRLEGNNYSSSKAEAELGALRIFEAEGLKLSLRYLKSTRKHIEYEARKDTKEFGAERSPIVIEALAEFDRRIGVLETPP